MDIETYEALKSLMSAMDRHAKATHSYKRVSNWIDEVAKDYEEEKRYCHLCGAEEVNGGWCSNKSCFEYTRHEKKP